MNGDARVALDRLVAAFETHHAAVVARRGDRDPSVEAAYLKLADAFEAYDDVLMDVHNETTPFVVYDEDEEFFDDDDFEGNDDAMDDEYIVLETPEAQVPRAD